MTRLHFQPIQGKALDILDTILKNEEVASADDVWGKLSVVVEELVVGAGRLQIIADRVDIALLDRREKYVRLLTDLFQLPAAVYCAARL